MFEYPKLHCKNDMELSYPFIWANYLIIHAPDFFCFFWGGFLKTKPPFKVTSAEVVMDLPSFPSNLPGASLKAWAASGSSTRSCQRYTFSGKAEMVSNTTHKKILQLQVTTRIEIRLFFGQMSKTYATLQHILRISSS